jgi:hypothetical protein
MFRLLLLIVPALVLSVCTNRPHNPQPSSSDTSDSDLENAIKAFVAGTGGTRTANWGTIKLRGVRTKQVLAEISRASATLVISQDNESGARRCRVYFQGELSTRGWQTKQVWNDVNGQRLLLRLHNNLDGSVEKFELGRFHIDCDDAHQVIDRQVFYDDSFFNALDTAEFVLEPYGWDSCGGVRPALAR